jgi:hypothetical protein
MKATLDTSGPTPRVTLTWVPSKTNVGGSPITVPLTFNLYRAQLNKTRSGMTGDTAVVTFDLPTGSTQFFAITEIENGVESGLSNIEQVTIP